MQKKSNESAEKDTLLSFMHSAYIYTYTVAVQHAHSSAGIAGLQEEMLESNFCAINITKQHFQPIFCV